MVFVSKTDVYSWMSNEAEQSRDGNPADSVVDWVEEVTQSLRQLDRMALLHLVQASLVVASVEGSAVALGAEEVVSVAVEEEVTSVGLVVEVVSATKVVVVLVDPEPATNHSVHLLALVVEVVMEEVVVAATATITQIQGMGSATETVTAVVVDKVIVALPAVTENQCKQETADLATEATTEVAMVTEIATETGMLIDEMTTTQGSDTTMIQATTTRGRNEDTDMIIHAPYGLLVGIFVYNMLSTQILQFFQLALPFFLLSRQG